MTTQTPQTLISIEHLNAYFGDKHIVKDVSMSIPEKKILAIIGPSGCGKSTMLRCINRLHEETSAAKVTGRILLNHENILDRNTDPVVIRQKIGMVFQKPSAFPGLSILENVIAGRLLKGEKKSHLENVAETALKQASLWDEVKDKLNAPGTSLSGGQQQRLCIARALAVKPDVILMDEPTSALDPISAARIEDLIIQIQAFTTVIIVTHNLQQAARISHQTAFMNAGKLIELNNTGDMFTNPREKLTEEYITGKFS